MKMKTGIKVEVKVLYFGLLQQAANCAEESIQTGAENLGDLYQERAQALKIDYPIESVKFAQNEIFCHAKTVLQSGDTIAFMPPMAGG